MKEAILIIVWVINFAISWWNARTVGLSWVETKAMGGFTRFMAWMGAIMSASGFTWCYLIILLLGGHYIEPLFLKEGQQPVLNDEAVLAGFSLGYLIIIPGVLFSGLMIWVDSVAQAWKKRSFGNIATASWNTFAKIHNTYSAMRGMPEAFGRVSKFFSGKGDSKGKGALFIVMFVVLALISGILTTWAIINQYAGSRQLEPKRSM